MPASVIAGPFTLGTAQLGMVYGLGSDQPSTVDGAAFAILDEAARAGVVWLDTARSYGDSETKIGQWLADHSQQFRIVTKIPSLARVSDAEAGSAARRSIEESLNALGLNSLDVCLVHRASDLRRAPVAAALQEAKLKGKIRSFGASVYTPTEGEALLATDGVGVLQIPFSVVRQDFLDSGLIARAAERGIVLFARSVFLQGALLMPSERLPAYLRGLHPVNVVLAAIAKNNQLSLPALLMGAVRSVPGVASLVLGVDSVRQLRELAEAAEIGPLPSDVVKAAFLAGRGLPPRLVDPRNWPSRF